MFPEGEASSKRVFGVASALADAGRQVVIGSGETEPSTAKVLFRSAKNGTISYHGLGEKTPRTASTFKKLANWLIFQGERTVRWLDEQPTKPSHVIYYGTNAAFIIRLLLWCRKNGVTFIVDVVEWHDPRGMPGGYIGPFNISDKISLRILIPKACGIIVISSLLEKYYLVSKCHIIRVPPILDTTKVVVNRTNRNFERELVLAYAGRPGKKDLVNNVIEAVLLLDENGRKVRFIMVGPSVRDILCVPALRLRKMSSLPSCIAVLGPQSHDKAIAAVNNADFMPLLRPLKLYAEAGFPTKIVESLASGIPVICNLTSDLGEYIHDGAEGFICRDYSVEAFKQALERALSLKPEKWIEMSKAARAQAERSFDYRNYTEKIASFMEKTRQLSPKRS